MEWIALLRKYENNIFSLNLSRSLRYVDEIAIVLNTFPPVNETIWRNFINAIAFFANIEPTNHWTMDNWREMVTAEYWRIDVKWKSRKKVKLPLINGITIKRKHFRWMENVPWIPYRYCSAYYNVEIKWNIYVWNGKIYTETTTTTRI